MELIDHDWRSFDVRFDRTPAEDVTYPDDDLQIASIDGRRQFARKDGTPY